MPTLVHKIYRVYDILNMVTVPELQLSSFESLSKVTSSR